MVQPKTRGKSAIGHKNVNALLNNSSSVVTPPNDREDNSE